LEKFVAGLGLGRQYGTVKLPSKMLEAIEILIEKHPECGFSSKADFVKDAVRHHYCWHVHKIRFKEE
jgi:hypothetical protein